MNDEELLKEMRRALKESVENFSDANKSERERLTLTQFLLNLGVDFENKEVLPQTNDPPDVIFRGACYEIKEVLDPRRWRHAEYKAALAKALVTTNPAELFENVDIEDITPVQIGQLISGKLTGLNLEYEPQFRASLNLLFYVDLERHSLQMGPMPPLGLFSTFGWRSISVLIGWGALVFFAESNAPVFLQAKVGIVTLRQFK